MAHGAEYELFVNVNRFPFDMKKNLIGISILALLLFVSCSQSNVPGPPVLNDLSEANYHLVNQDSAKVNFVQDLKGKYTILGFIYTHCQFMCRLITANMGKMQQLLGKAPNVQFVEITFDPKRDTPARLRHYMKAYKLNPRNFEILTGDSTTIARVMRQAHIKYFVNKRDTTKAGVPQYFSNIPTGLKFSIKKDGFAINIPEVSYRLKNDSGFETLTRGKWR